MKEKTLDRLQNWRLRVMPRRERQSPVLLPPGERLVEAAPSSRKAGYGRMEGAGLGGDPRDGPVTLL